MLLVFWSQVSGSSSGIFEKQKPIRENTEPPKGMKGNALESWLLSNRRPLIR